MAQDLSPLFHTILARALIHLRGTLLFPGLVNSDFAPEAAEKGDTVDVRLPTKMSAYDIVPGIIPTEPLYAEDISPIKVPIKLDFWKGSSFHLTDKDVQEIDADEHFIPVQSIEAIDAIAEVVNDTISANFTKAFGFVGTPGETPFQDVSPAVDPEDGTRAMTLARKELNVQKAPRRDRRFVMDPDASGNALGLRAFQDASQFGDDSVKKEGEIGRAFGMGIFEELAMPTHVAGSTTGSAIIAKAATVQIVGLKLIECNTGSGGAVAYLEGDIITFAGSTQTHVVTADTTEGSADTAFNLPIEPGLKVQLEGSELIAHLTDVDHVTNLAFHRDGFAFVNRPLADGLESDNSSIVAVTDPLSGLTLRLERKRERKRWVWEYDMLWGTELVIRELVVRVAG